MKDRKERIFHLRSPRLLGDFDKSKIPGMFVSKPDSKEQGLIVEIFGKPVLVPCSSLLGFLFPAIRR